MVLSSQPFTDSLKVSHPDKGMTEMMADWTAKGFINKPDCGSMLMAETNACQVGEELGTVLSPAREILIG